MSAADRFFDTNVLLDLLSADPYKADIAENLVATGGQISVQVLNEFASVAMRKLNMSCVEVREVLKPVRALCRVIPLTEEIHELGLRIAERYRFSVYDSMIVAAALTGGCETLLSEDLQDGFVIDGALRVCNPFAEQS